MKVKLFDFQKEALHQLREKLLLCRASVSPINPQAIVFAAPTGSGKTIVATALFEAILETPDEQLEWPSAWSGDANSVILWLSYSPDLNEQTRLKIESKSDRVNRVNQLVTIDSSFDAEKLEGGCVYFLNVQKLAAGQPLTRKEDGRAYTIWETLTNTIRTLPRRFYVVIDEAHQGMGSGARNSSSAAEASSLVQRFLLGYPDVGLPKMPIVIGVSATPQRFTNLVIAAGAGHTIHSVSISPGQVRGSGLLKERVLIHYPKAVQNAEITLLEEAARQWSTLSAAWGDYCRAQRESQVWPVLVVQIENGTAESVTRTNLAQVLNAIERSIGRPLREGEVVHAINDAQDLDIDGRLVCRVDASKIDADVQIGVVLFKTALSTGWDCPRAEVMMSFRAAQDSTYVAQLLGRMVRTPLARRIEQNALLNDVHLFLPHFDRRTVGSVITALQDVEAVPPTETGTSDELVVLERDPKAEVIFTLLSGLVTYRVNAVRAQSHLRRYVALARALTKDDISDNAWQDAERNAVEWLDSQLVRMVAAGTFEQAAKALNVVSVETQVSIHGSLAETQQYHVDASEDDINRLFDEAGRRWGNALHLAYWRAHEGRDSVEVKVVVVVLSQDATVTSELESLAGAAFDALYDANKLAIGRLNENKRSSYTRLRLATATAQSIPWELPASVAFRRSETAPQWEKHIYLEDGAIFKIELSSWEDEVLREELASPEIVGWLRNLDRKPWSFEIPYRTGGEVRPMFPDLIVVRKKGQNFVADVLEPHDPSLADNYEKAIGMAEYCERHGELIGRMELIRKVGSTFKRLDLNKSSVQSKVKLITTNAQLDAVFAEMAKP